ncbi:uncharacterized protein LTR77_004375 [Saxophila tyrrhenica]|uniref:Uncharacterized protein n=1 Tax=Saxophila tyrrhenica TaxID=1690608 RepID=A0AAV9PDF6_9PEZI|nr:hypothetical protein LTR77_004375 [Saxophila tyrrhenica]
MTEWTREIKGSRIARSSEGQQEHAYTAPTLSHPRHTRQTAAACKRGPARLRLWKKVVIGASSRSYPQQPIFKHRMSPKLCSTFPVSVSASDDFRLRIAFVGLQVLSHLHQLQQPILLHPFQESLAMERQFFEGQKWSVRELQFNLEYALEFADQHLAQWRGFLHSKFPSRHEIIDLSNSIEAEEAIAEDSILPKRVRPMDLTKIKVELPATIALLGIVQNRIKHLYTYDWEPQDRSFIVTTSDGRGMLIDPPNDEDEARVQQKWRWSIAVVAQTAHAVETEYAQLTKVFEDAVEKGKGRARG